MDFVMILSESHIKFCGKQKTYKCTKQPSVYMNCYFKNVLPSPVRRFHQV